jgi:hypothetical protein
VTNLHLSSEHNISFNLLLTGFLHVIQSAEIQGANTLRTEKCRLDFFVLKFKNAITSSMADTKKKLVYYLYGMNTTKHA